jgi:hypothetical protein
MKYITRVMMALVVFGWTTLAQASLMQDVYFFLEPPEADFSNAVGLAHITLPQASGCVSGELIYAGLLDCDDGFGGNTNNPEEVLIDGTFGPALLAGGFWDINSDGFLEGLLSFLNDSVEVVFASDPSDLYPDETNPVGAVGQFLAVVFEDDQGTEVGGGVIAIPQGNVPVPQTLALFGLGLMVLGWMRRK